MLGLQVVACFCTKFINMKNLFFSIRRAVVLLAFFAFSNVLLAQKSCADSPADCINEGSSSIFLKIPNFTNSTCKILLSYTRINCNGVINVYDFVYTPIELNVNNSSKCNYFIDSLMTKPEFARRVDVLAGRQVADDIAKQVIFSPTGDPTDFTCNTTSPKVVEVSYYRAKCIAFGTGYTTVETLVSIKKTLLDEPGGSLSILFNQDVSATIACKGDGCCKLTRSYCFKNGKLDVDEKTSSFNIKLPGLPLGSCPLIAPPKPPTSYSIYTNVVWRRASPCVPVCGNIPPPGKVTSNATYLTDDAAMFFQNPTDGNLSVNFTQEVVGFIEIQDMNGRLEKRVPVNQDRSIEIDLFNLSSGMYYVVLQHKDGRIETQKLVKQ